MSSRLYSLLDSSADVLRSKMDASEYKSYLLGIIFYKYLSDELLDYVYSGFAEYYPDHDTGDRLDFYTNLYDDEDEGDDLREELKGRFRYSMEPEHTYDAMVKSVLGQSDEPFQLETFAQGLRDVEASNERFEDLFSDMDLNSRRLGSTRSQQSKTIADVMKVLSAIDFSGHAGDVLGDAYEYLIRQFAMEAGKRAGEFYTPQEVSKLMTRIVVDGKEDKKGFSVYDPTCGSGSLLLNVANAVEEPEYVRYFGQELNTTTFNLARMNMLLHDVSVDNYTLRNGDTLDEDWPSEEPTDFDAVLMNPPYSAKWNSDKSMLDDPRFAPYGKLAPKNYADLAFLLHGFHHLKSDGTMAIVLPHGPLFRNMEKEIRTRLLKEGSIDTIIGLPADIFYNTSIPTVIMILKKDRVDRDVLFIDASEMYESRKAQNHLTDEHIDEIVKMYNDREFVDKRAYLVEFDEIKENDFNLNIPRYVDTFEPEPEIDLRDVSKKINQTNDEANDLKAELFDMMYGLVGNDDSSQEQLDGFLASFEKELD